MYKMTLRPVGPYFFGTERGYGPDNASYFATSRRFPQQSTLLGMLRYRLLEMRGWLFDSSGKSDSKSHQRRDLIGSHSFRPSKADKARSYGAIRSISDLQLEDDADMLLPGALDRGYTYSYTTEGQYTTLLEGAHEAKVRRTIPDLGSAFDYKDQTDPHLIRVGDVSKPISLESVFVESQRVGITKDRSISEDKAFFKQQNYQLAKGYRFVCYVDIAPDIGTELSQWVAAQPLIAMGGERSVFAMTLEAHTPPEAQYNHYKTSATQAERWVLLSDAYMSVEYQQQFDFAVSRATFYRGLRTHVKRTRHYADLDRSGEATHGQVTKSAGFPLLLRGSVFYPPSNDSDRLADAWLAATVGWHQIGYNRVVRIKDGTITTLTPQPAPNE